MTETHHIGELKLRRLWAGEPLGVERPMLEAHASSCPSCRARFKDLGDQQRRFEDEISFDRFAAGVERAARRPLTAPRPRTVWLAPALGMAAAIALIVTVAGRDTSRFGVAPGANRIKGGSGITVRIAAGDHGPQRDAAADAPEPLAPGDRLRIGFTPDTHGFLMALSVDDAGTVTAIYPESGRSVPVHRGGETRYLPDSVELTGQGAERLVVVLSDQPLEVVAVQRAAQAAYTRAKGDVRRLPTLDVEGQQFHRTFLKP